MTIILVKCKLRPSSPSARSVVYLSCHKWQMALEFYIYAIQISQNHCIKFVFPKFVIHCKK